MDNRAIPRLTGNVTNSAETPSATQQRPMSGQESHLSLPHECAVFEATRGRHHPTRGHVAARLSRVRRSRVATVIPRSGASRPGVPRHSESPRVHDQDGRFPRTAAAPFYAIRARTGSARPPRNLGSDRTQVLGRGGHRRISRLQAREHRRRAACPFLRDALHDPVVAHPATGGHEAMRRPPGHESLGLVRRHPVLVVRDGVVPAGSLRHIELGPAFKRSMLPIHNVCRLARPRPRKRWRHCHRAARTIRGTRV